MCRELDRILYEEMRDEDVFTILTEDNSDIDSLCDIETGEAGTLFSAIPELTGDELEAFEDLYKDLGDENNG